MAATFTRLRHGLGVAAAVVTLLLGVTTLTIVLDAAACRPSRPHVRRAPGTPAVVQTAAEPVSVPAPVMPATGVPDFTPRLAPEDGCAPDRLPWLHRRRRGCEVGAGVALWLSRRPHTPLARVEGGAIGEVDVPCCAAFAARGTRWHEVDRWGHDVGEVSIAGGEFYDATGCIEQCVAGRRGRGGVGLLVSSAVPWRSPPSARLDPSPAQWSAARALDATVSTLTERQAAPVPLPERVLFFRAPAGTGGTAGGAAGGDYLVLGGNALVIARWNGSDRWVVEIARVEASEWPETHTPVAVFDMNADGFPEVVIERDGGDGWGNTVYVGEGNGHWQRLVGIGGSTA